MKVAKALRSLNCCADFTQLSVMCLLMLWHDSAYKVSLRFWSYRFAHMMMPQLQVCHSNMQFRFLAIRALYPKMRTA